VATQDCIVLDGDRRYLTVWPTWATLYVGGVSLSRDDS